MTAATATKNTHGKALGRTVDAPATGQITGEPIELRIEDVEEDPDQPRQTFDEKEMAELAESIAAYGVKVPISVHRHPDRQGRYIINDGARRFRGSILAGKEAIPCVVVEAFSLVEQLIVNKIRADTPPKDKARVFARIMQKNGWTQKQLVESTKGKGKNKDSKGVFSEAYVSQHMALLSLPAPINAVFDSGRCGDVTVINELAKAYKKKAEVVEAWLADEDQEITRGSVRMLREFIDEKRKPGEGDDDDGGLDAKPEGADGGKETKEKVEKEPDPEKVKKALILGMYKRRVVRLMPNKRWSAEGFAWVKYEDNGEEIEIELGQLKLNRLIEA